MYAYPIGCMHPSLGGACNEQHTCASSDTPRRISSHRGMSAGTPALGNRTLGQASDVTTSVKHSILYLDNLKVRVSRLAAPL